MSEEYPILCGKTTVGRAYVARQGLYYRMECRCGAQETPVRLRVTGIGGSAELGICVPMDTGFGMVTRIPIKQLGEGRLSFSQQEESRAPASEFIPIRSGQPLSCLSRLPQARLASRDGQLGLLFTDRSEGPPGNDPSR